MVCAPLVRAANALTLQRGTYADHIARDHYTTHPDSWTVSEVRQTYPPGPAPGVRHIHHQLPHQPVLTPHTTHVGYTHTNQMAPVLVRPIHSFARQYATVQVCFLFFSVQSDNDMTITPSPTYTWRVTVTISQLSLDNEEKYFIHPIY